MKHLSALQSIPLINLLQRIGNNLQVLAVMERMSPCVGNCLCVRTRTIYHIPRALRAPAALRLCCDDSVSHLQVLAVVGHVSPRIRAQMIMFTYYNPIMRRGAERFCQQAKAAGASGATQPRFLGEHMSGCVPLPVY